MELIKTYLEIASHTTYEATQLEQSFRFPPNTQGWFMFEMWTTNTLIGFNYETT